MEEENALNIREAAEEAEYEGLRSLLESQVLVMKGQERNDVEITERSEEAEKLIRPNEDRGSCLNE